MVHKRRVVPVNVLVVCHGNICRSPLVGAMLARRLGPDCVRDRGLGSKPNRAVAKKVREYAAGIGIDLSAHRSCLMTTADVEWCDLLVYMDQGNYKRLSSAARMKARCLAEWVGRDRIPDPNYLPRGPALQEILNLATVAATRLAAEVSYVG